MPGFAEVLTGPVLEVAPRLLGAVLRHETEEGVVAVRLTEVEAYAGEQDPGSHAFRGPTRRTEVMFGPAGRLYVYLSYGMHYCCNVVCGPEGRASAVLLRAGQVIDGIDLARQRRGERVTDRALARGPACLAQALGIDKSDNGVDLLDSGSLALGLGKETDPARIASGPRVGLSLAHDVPWRYWVSGDVTVSAYKRSPRAPAG